MAEFGQKATFTGHSLPQSERSYPALVGLGIPHSFAECSAAIIGYPRAPSLHVRRPPPFRMACAARYSAACAIAGDAAWAGGGMAGQPDHLQCGWHAQRGDDHVVIRQSRRLRRRPWRHAVLPVLRGPWLQPRGTPGRLGFCCATRLGVCRAGAPSGGHLPPPSQVPGACKGTAVGVIASSI